MTFDNPIRRHAARRVAVAGATLSAIVMCVSASAFLPSGRASAAAVDAGAAQIVVPTGVPGAGQPLSNGGTATSFGLKLPAGAACAADGTNGGRWHTYMVPAAEDQAAVAFAGNGALVGASIGTGGTGTFRNSVYSTAGTPVRGQAPNLGDAVIINIPNMRFSVWSTGNIPLGSYDTGIACVDLDLANARDNFWNTQLTIEADVTDPKGIKWVAVDPGTTTTTSTSTTTTTTTSTTTPTTTGSTTTTTADDTTTTTTTSTDDTTTSSTPDDTTSATDPGGVLGGSIDNPGDGSALPATGQPVLRFVVSAFLLLVFGRMAVLLGRPILVLGPRP